jgi:iron(III) transport system permease protein
MPASVAIKFLDDNGAVGPAAAMAVMIVLTSGAVRLGQWALTHRVLKASSRWKTRTQQASPV